MNVFRMAKGLVNPQKSVAQVRCVYDNMGDIMVFRAIDRLLHGLNVVTYSKANPKLHALERTIGLQRVFKYSMLGGGTLIFAAQNVGWLDEVEYILARTNPLCTFGTGVIDPCFLKQVHDSTGQKTPLNQETLDKWLLCLRKIPFVGVRGFESARILAENGFTSAEVIGDPALVYALDAIQPKTRLKKIGVNILDTSYFWPNSKEHALAEMISFLGKLVKNGWDVTLFPASHEDLALAGSIRSNDGLERIKLFNNFLDVDAYLEGLAAMDLFVGMRLHSYVAACCVYTPAIMIGYQPKGLDFIRTIDLGDYYIRTDQLSSEDLMARITDLYENLQDVQQEQFVKCARMKMNLQKFAQRVKQYVYE